MKELKREILFLLLFMVIGIAAVTTNVIVNLSTSINKNPDDFLVYFSDVKVDGTQDLSLVENEHKLVFNGEFIAVGDKKIISYDVTNASRNYDAEILIGCTESTTYLNITNTFDMKSTLSARSSRTGTLTIELANAVSEEVLQDVTCTITANAVERDSQGSDEVDEPVENPYPIGMEIALGDELFNVISSTNDTVTMLAKYNLSFDYRQTSENKTFAFSRVNGWEYAPGPKEIDVISYEGYAQTFLTEYISYLKSITGDSSLTATFISLRELKSLGCIINDNYKFASGLTCANSPYKDWLINGQNMWTRSVCSSFSPGNRIWLMDYAGGLFIVDYDANNGGGRPLVTISKSVLE